MEYPWQVMPVEQKHLSTTHAKIFCMSKELTENVRTLSDSTKFLSHILQRTNTIDVKNSNISEHLSAIESNSIKINGFCKSHTTFQSLDNDQYLTFSIAIDQLQTFVEKIGDAQKTDMYTLETELTERTHKRLQTTIQFLGDILRLQTGLKVKGVYVIVDPQATMGIPVGEIAASAVRGGANVIQLRDKVSNKTTVSNHCKEIRTMCDINDTLFIANDNPDIAVQSNAHGLHLGRDDTPVHKARVILSAKQIIGTSNNNVEDLDASIAAGSDYLAVGAIFPTNSAGKIDRPVVGTQLIEKAKNMCNKPIVAIGGINEKNVGEVARAGADSICVIKSVCGSKNPEESTARLVEAFQTSK